MKCTITKPIEINAKYVDVYIGGRPYPEDVVIGDDDFADWDWEDVFEKYPMLKGNCNGNCELYLRINVDNGKVENWPENTIGCFDTVKVVDEGTYILQDNDLNEIVKYEGYVPDFLEINGDGYGDYWMFNINKNGFIEDWDFTQRNVNELFEIYDD